MFILFTFIVSLILGCSKNEEIIMDNPDVQESCRAREEKQFHGLDQDRFITLNYHDLKVHYRIIGKGPIDVVLFQNGRIPSIIKALNLIIRRAKGRSMNLDHQLYSSYNPHFLLTISLSKLLPDTRIIPEKDNYKKW